MMRPQGRRSVTQSRVLRAAAFKATIYLRVRAITEPLESRRLLSTVVVNTTVDQTDLSGSSTVSLRDALTIASAASTPTTITFDPTVFATQQTITLNGAAALELTANQNVTLTAPSAGVVISGNSRSSDLIDQSAATTAVGITGVTFTDGASNYGGGIEHTGLDTLTLTNVTVSSNTGYYDGGGIYNAGQLVIDGSTILDNAATNLESGYGAGGGIVNAGGTLSIIDSTISGNTSESLNAIGGGGIANIRAGSLTITDSTVSGNSTYANQPGGLPVNAPGGGVFSTGQLTITNSTISGNSGSLGGGMYISDGVTLSDSTISGNTGTRGGGLYLTTDDTLQNSVVSGNTNFTNGASPDVATRGSDAVLSNGFNFIGQSDGSSGWVASDKIGTVADPIDAKLGPLTDNGGPTLTQLPKPGSPLIDTGSNALIPAGITTDQRGLVRIFNTNVDIGAVETQSSISVTAPEDQSAIAGQLQDFDLGSFTESGGEIPFSVVVNWGDGSAATTFTTTASGTLASQPHTYAGTGAETVTVTVTDASGAVGSSNTFAVDVGGESIDVTGPTNQTAFVGISQAFTLGSFTQTNAVQPYSVAVNWGDGSPDTTFTVFNAGAIPAQSHTFTTTGTSTVSINVADGSGDVTSGASFDVSVMLGSIAVTPAEAQNAGLNQSKSIQLGSFTAANVNSPFGIKVDWGDGSADTILTAAAAGVVPTQLHLFSQLGADTVTVTVTDASGLVKSTGSFAVTVTQAGISVIPPANQKALIGETTSISLGSFSETDATTPFAISINWGDGTADTAISQAAVGALPVEPHVFSTVGSSLVMVTVTDASGAVSGEAGFTVTTAVGSARSTVSIGITNTQFAFAQPQTITATVSPSTATGVITFFQNGVAIGSANVSGGMASLTSSAFASGNDTLTAAYGGDGTFAAGTSSPLDISVSPPANTTALQLQSSNGSIDSTLSVTLTATVTPPSSNGVAATGTVTFYQADVVLGTAAVVTGGLAQLTTSTPLPVGADAITAKYSGDVNFAASQSPAISITVTPAATAVALSISNTSKTVAQQAAYSATVSLLNATSTTLGGIVPDGIVSFSANGTAFGTANVDANGVATLITSAALPLGSNSITANYVGDVNFSPSASANLSLYVTQHALLPVINRVVVPTSAIAGQRIRGSVTATLTNLLTASGAALEKGIFSVQLYASPTSVFDPADDTLLTKVPRSATIRHGKAVRLAVGLTSFPITLAAGSYHLILETIDSAGNAESVDTGSTVNVESPVVALAASFVTIPPAVAKKGAVVSLTNTGNVNDLSKFTVTISLSTSATGLNSVATVAGKLQPASALLRPAKPAKLHITGWQSLFATVPAGNYYLTETITDSSGHTATAVSPTPIAT